MSKSSNEVFDSPHAEVAGLSDYVYHINHYRAMRVMEEIYSRYFGRKPDACGISYYLPRLIENLNYKSNLEDEVAKSPELHNKIELLYNYSLNRSPSLPEILTTIGLLRWCFFSHYEIKQLLKQLSIECGNDCEFDVWLSEKLFIK